MQGGRSARLSRHFPRVMQQAIFRPLAQGSRERYALITDIQVWAFGAGSWTSSFPPPPPLALPAANGFVRAS